MKITRSHLRKLILEELSVLNERKVNVTADGGTVDIEKLTSRFYQERNVKPGSGESLEFTVTKDNVTGPDGMEKEVKLVDGVRRKLAAYNHIPDGVTLTVTYSN
tara:strand:+ start:204 stop:515 length:312 start_codon:yes stop_codon:yes gene_type:complete